MASIAERQAEDNYDARYDRIGGDVPNNEAKEDSYPVRDAKEPVTVKNDETSVRDQLQPPTSSTDPELGQHPFY